MKCQSVPKRCECFRYGLYYDPRYRGRKRYSSLQMNSVSDPKRIAVDGGRAFISDYRTM